VLNSYEPAVVAVKLYVDSGALEAPQDAIKALGSPDVFPLVVTGTVEPRSFPGQTPQPPQSAAQLLQSSKKSQVPSPQPAQAPQSAAQVVQSSVQSQTLSPQTGQAPQSPAQVLQSSVQSQMKSPQTGQAPQSWLQVEHDSLASQRPSPQDGAHGVPQTLPTSETQSPSQKLVQQNGSTAQIWAAQGLQVSARGSPTVHSAWQTQAPQSPAQLLQFSLQSQTLSPQTGQAPQSDAQVVQSSVQSQTLSPQTGQAPQSDAQVLQSSVQSQMKSPQTGQAPQSWLQVEHDSLAGSQMKSPQDAAHGVPQMLPTSETQIPSQKESQQNGSTAQIWATQGLQVSSRGSPTVHSAWQTQAPQSPAQVLQSSVQSQTLSPQTGQPPQSDAQVLQSSVQSQTLSPQTGQAPQSWLQVEHDSVIGSQRKSPQDGAHGAPQTLPTSETQSPSQ
jgi:hypothetical protein